MRRAESRRIEKEIVHGFDYSSDGFFGSGVNALRKASGKPSWSIIMSPWRAFYRGEP